MPGRLLKSDDVLRAMELGAVPVVSNTAGASVFLGDCDHGIVLEGSGNMAWEADMFTSSGKGTIRSLKESDRLLVDQMTTRVAEVLDPPEAFIHMQRRALDHCRSSFSGKAFCEQFWEIADRLYAPLRNCTGTRTGTSIRFRGLEKCLVSKKEYADFAASDSRPRIKINTGLSTVWELGGAFAQATGNRSPDQHPWYGILHPFVQDETQLIVVRDIADLSGAYLSPRTSRGRIPSRTTSMATEVLQPFPGISRILSAALKLYGSAATFCRRFMSFFLQRFTGRRTPEDCEPILHDVSGFAIFRYCHRYYAIPQGEGYFDIHKARSGSYTSCLGGYSLRAVLKSLAAVNGKADILTNVPERSTQTPILKKEGVRGYNIIQLDDMFYAILQGDGAFRYIKLVSGGYTRFYSGNSVAEVEKMILSSQGHHDDGNGESRE
ncbi:MAG: hypothetical protein V1793_06530 [Pseudomonadota bacterium]